jgi:hypothetical protein
MIENAESASKTRKRSSSIGQRVLFVGINPSRVTDTGKYTLTIRKLHEWALTMGLQFFSFVNVGHDPNVFVPEKEFLLDSLQARKYDAIVALGNVASSCLKKMGVEHYKLPHPSPRNRLLNDKSFESACLESCRSYIEERA